MTERTEAELLVTTPTFRAFVSEVHRIVESAASPELGIESLKAPFARLLRDDNWLPEEFARPAEKSGMGGGIGQYLLYRSADRDLSVSSLVLPAGAQTPIHDHLAWGLVGLYRGEQHEEVFLRDSAESEEQAELRLTERRHLRRGDFYHLLPPIGDIHRVVAASDQPSVSIHLLRNDVGCINRHRFDLGSGQVTPFRSGYVNVECVEDRPGEAG